MTKADRVYSTPPLNTPVDQTRRRFLSTAAGIAAGSTALALAIPPARAADDPIFALIEAHRTTADALFKACLDISRRQEILINEGSGLCPFVAIADSGRPVVAYSHEQIDAYNHSSERVRTRAHAALEAAIERNQTVMGDAERVRDSAGDADTEAWEELLSTPPTSMAGVRELLAYILRDVDDIDFLLGDLSVAALTSIEDALEALNPAA
jgi:hypothetical protein